MPWVEQLPSASQVYRLLLLYMYAVAITNAVSMRPHTFFLIDSSLLHVLWFGRYRGS